MRKIPSSIEKYVTRESWTCDGVTCPDLICTTVVNKEKGTFYTNQPKVVSKQVSKTSEKERVRLANVLHSIIKDHNEFAFKWALNWAKNNDGSDPNQIKMGFEGDKNDNPKPASAKKTVKKPAAKKKATTKKPAAKKGAARKRKPSK